MNRTPAAQKPSKQHSKHRSKSKNTITKMKLSPKNSTKKKFPDA